MNLYRWLFLLILFVIPCAPATAWAKFTIQTQTPAEIELTVFDGLDDRVLFHDELAVGSHREIDTPYRGLALLGFAGGQSYPVIIGDQPFVLQIIAPGQLPAFTGSGANDFLYQALADGKYVPSEEYPFVDLLLRARELLQSTYTIKTTDQLAAKKKELNDFVATHYEDLAHSDMVRRLMAQSFMMHEYVSYHVEGQPTTAIQARYQAAVLDGVAGWLKTLRPHLPANRIVNACVDFYYARSMVALASLIIDRFPDEAFCQGKADVSLSLPADLAVADAQRKRQGTLAGLQGEKTIALVADDCPVSMVKAVAKARELAKQKAATPLIVAPLQELNATHRAMAKMIRGETILFIDDERWQRMKPATRPRLPFIFQIER